VRRNWLIGLLCLVAVFGLIRGITAGALWEPHELSVAELSRRIALNLLGAADLAVPGADNSLPIRADLGRGELPFTSAALGFRLFGLSEWAGRLPLLVWALFGLAALYAALCQLWDRRAALYGVVILATTPLYFLQARTLLGDAVTLATFAIAWSGLATAALAPALARPGRLGFAALGALGLYAGFWCRGPILSVAVPALAVGLAARFEPAPSKLARALGLASLALGVLAGVAGFAGLWLAEQRGDYSVFVGSALAETSAPSFDAALGDLAHAAFPWSALAPLSLALPWQRPEPATGRAAAVSAVLALGLGLAAVAWLEPSIGRVVLPAAACFAVLLAGALRELETRARPLPLAAMACAALAVMLGSDLYTYPEKVLAGFGLSGTSLPESLQPQSATLWRWGALALAAGICLCLLERDGPEPPPVWQRAEYQRVLVTLQRTWDGNLVFAILVLEAGLVGFLVLSAVSERLIHLEQLDSFGLLTRKLVAASAVLVPVAALLPWAAMLARDVARVVFGRPWPGRLAALSPTRSQGVLCVAAAVALSGSLGFYPALSQQVSPKLVFERYRQLSRPGEPLGILGDASAAARYQAGASAQRLGSLEAAFDWLDAGGDAAARRWLLVRSEELPRLNALFRERHAQNLPVLDARSSELLLASNRRLAYELDANPLAGVVLDAPPVPQHPLRAVLGGKLEVLGWSVSAPTGEPVVRVSAGKPYRFVIYYRVLAPLTGSWQAFVHVDGLQRRFNADHALLQGKYPLSAWRAGDVLADATELLLEPNFSPGQYRVYFGLYSSARRLEVTQGPAADDRIAAGTLEIE
jgi:hypothetical protein